MKAMNRRRVKSLVCQHLENVSGSVLEEFQAIIRDHVKGRHGIYALFKNPEVGRGPQSRPQDRAPIASRAAPPRGSAAR